MPSFAALLLPVTPTTGSMASDPSVGPNTAVMEDAGHAFSAALSLVQDETDAAAETAVAEAAINPPPVAPLAFAPHILISSQQQELASIASATGHAVEYEPLQAASAVSGTEAPSSDLTAFMAQSLAPNAPAQTPDQALDRAPEQAKPSIAPQPVSLPLQAASGQPITAPSLGVEQPNAPQAEQVARPVEAPQASPSLAEKLAEPAKAQVTPSVENTTPRAQSTQVVQEAEQVAPPVEAQASQSHEARLVPPAKDQATPSVENTTPRAQSTQVVQDAEQVALHAEAQAGPSGEGRLVPPAKDQAAPSVESATPLAQSMQAAQGLDRNPVIKAQTATRPETLASQTATVTDANVSPVVTTTDAEQAAQQPPLHHKLTAVETDPVAPPAKFAEFKSVTANLNPAAFMGASSNAPVQTASLDTASPVQAAPVQPAPEMMATADNSPTVTALALPQAANGETARPSTTATTTVPSVEQKLQTASPQPVQASPVMASDAAVAAPAPAPALKLDAQYGFNVITRLAPADYQAAVPAPVLTTPAPVSTQADFSTSDALATPLMAQTLGLAPMPITKGGAMPMAQAAPASMPVVEGEQSAPLLPKTVASEAVTAAAPQVPSAELNTSARLSASPSPVALEQASLPKADSSVATDFGLLDSLGLDEASPKPTIEQAELSPASSANTAPNPALAKTNNPIINPQQGLDNVPAQLTNDGTEAGQIQTAQLDLDAGSGTAIPADLPSSLSKATIETTAQISAQILRKLEGRSTRFDMTLTPEALGRVDVSLTIEADGQVSARLAFDNPAAASELRGRVDELRRQLADAGLNLPRENLEFTDRNPQSGSGGGAFERGQNRRAFAGAARLNQEADLASAPTPALWASSSSLTRDRVDVKV